MSVRGEKLVIALARQAHSHDSRRVKTRCVQLDIGSPWSDSGASLLVQTSAIDSDTHDLHYLMPTYSLTITDQHGKQIHGKVVRVARIMPGKQ